MFCLFVCQKKEIFALCKINQRWDNYSTNHLSNLRNRGEEDTRQRKEKEIKKNC